MAVIDSGSSTAGKANVDANYNLQVNLPTIATQAGYAQLAYAAGGGVSNIQRVSQNGAGYSATVKQLLEIDFNSATPNFTNRFNAQATTMTRAVSVGAMRLNSGAITTTTTGISITSARWISRDPDCEYRISGTIRHTNGAVSNKQAEFGLGYYNFASGQANAMNEFIGFRWTTSGTLLAVVSTSAGGAGSEQTENVNGGVPFSDSVYRSYEIVINQDRAKFFVDGVYQTMISRQQSAYSLTKSQSLPVIARLFNSGVPVSAPTFDIAEISVFEIGNDADIPVTTLKSAQGKSSYFFPSDVIATASPTHNYPASGTAPTAATGSNTASVLNATTLMGGWYLMNGASIGATVHSTVWVAGYQNPVPPQAAGVAQNSRTLYVTGITVSPTVVSTVLAGGGFCAGWFAAIGGTALTSATADADGTTAVGQKADRLVPLARIMSYGAAAAVGTIETGSGECYTPFPTPLVINPGEFLKIGLRTFWVNAAVTSGVISGQINVNGYWD